VLQAGILCHSLKYKICTTYGPHKDLRDFELISDVLLDILNHSCKYLAITVFLNTAIVNFLRITLYIYFLAYMFVRIKILKVFSFILGRILYLPEVTI
jgi:hypothetical protein